MTDGQERREFYDANYPLEDESSDEDNVAENCIRSDNLGEAGESQGQVIGRGAASLADGGGGKGPSGHSRSAAHAAVSTEELADEASETDDEGDEESGDEDGHDTDDEEDDEARDEEDDEVEDTEGREELEVRGGKAAPAQDGWLRLAAGPICLSLTS